MRSVNIIICLTEESLEVCESIRRTIIIQVLYFPICLIPFNFTNDEYTPNVERSYKYTLAV